MSARAALPSYERLSPMTARWSPIGAYARTALLLLAIFAWAPIWVGVWGQRSLLGILGQVQFSGLVVFLTAPVSAVPISRHLRRATARSLSLPAVFVVLKVALVLLCAAVFYAVHAGAQADAAVPVPDAALPRALAFVMVGVPLSIPFGIVYGLAFQALLGALLTAGGRRAP